MKLVRRNQGEVEEIGKSERAETPERRLSLQRRSCFCEQAPTPLSAFQVELVSSSPASRHRQPSFSTYRPRPGQVRAAGESGRLAGPARSGHQQASADLSPSPVEKALPPPASLPFTPTLSPPLQPPPAQLARTERGARFHSATAGPQPLNWLQPAAATERASSRRQEGPCRGGEGASGQALRELGAVARSYLTPSVFSVSSSTAAAPAVAAAATFLGSAPAAAASSSTLCSPLFRRRAHRAPRPFGYLPRPPQHTRPETLSPTAPAAG